MLAPTTISEINTMRVRIETHLNYLSRIIKENTDLLIAAKMDGDDKRATTLSTQIESQKLNKTKIEIIDALLDSYSQTGDLRVLLDQSRIHQEKYATNWSLSNSIWGLFKTDASQSICSSFIRFVDREAKPLIEAEQAKNKYEAAQMREYFKTNQGKEMIETLRFISRG